MRTLFLAFAASALFSVAAVAQPDALMQPASFVIDENGQLEETKAPIIQFTEETFDFGELAEGPLVTHEFKLKNIGKEALVLSQVKASCGCTTPDWSKDPIAPGAESVIKVTYNTKGRVGAFNKAVTITSNAYTPTSRIYIKGTVKADPAAAQPGDPTKITPVGDGHTPGDGHKH